MIFYLLLLGHLLGDFVLQTDSIAENKGKYRRWIALHAFIVTLCIFALALPFGALTLGLVLLNGVIHYFIDYYKPVIIKTLKMSELMGFLTDQLLHVSLLYPISLAAVPDETSLLLQYPHVVKLLAVLAFLTSFAAVLNQFLFGAVFPRTGGRFFERGEKRMGIFTRLTITAAVYFSIVLSPLFLLLLPAAAAALFFAYRFGDGFRPRAGQLAFKVSLDFAVSIAGIYLIFRI